MSNFSITGEAMIESLMNHFHACADTRRHGNEMASEMAELAMAWIRDLHEFIKKNAPSEEAEVLTLKLVGVAQHFGATCRLSPLSRNLKTMIYGPRAWKATEAKKRQAEQKAAQEQKKLARIPRKSLAGKIKALQEEENKKHQKITRSSSIRARAKKYSRTVSVL